MKKFLSLVLALIMTMSLVTISAGATEYKDLTDKDEIQYEEAVAVLNRIGVITGYEDGSFRPETELTRGAAAKIIVSLMIGPDAASALPNNQSPYPDVPAGHTFAGVIGFCKTSGYISGYGDGTFKPANPLTGYAFAKMLLGAVGYKANIEGFVDTGWTMNVARIGNVAGLFDRLNFDGAKAVTRDEACQLALNTLKATLVDYGGTNTVISSSGEVLTVQGSKAQYVTSNNRNINANINRRVINAANNEMTLEFGEEHFQDLRLEHDKYDPAFDVYGHPSNEWSYKKVTIGTFPLPADFTFTKQMAHLEDTVASKEKALGLRGYDTWSVDHRANNSGWSTPGTGNPSIVGGSPFDDATQIIINGWDARADENGKLYTWHAESANGNTKAPTGIPTIAEICDLTDNGVTVEVYVCPVDADFITHVVVTRTQLMEVKRVASDYVALDQIDSDSKGEDLVEVTGYNDQAIDDANDGDIIDVKDNNYDAYNVLKELKAGDKVAVIPYTTDDGRTWEVGEAYVPEEVSGTLTKSTGYATSKKADGNAITVTVGGTEYPIAQWNKDLRKINADLIKATRKDVTLLLDKMGNALLAKDVGNADDWMIVCDYYQAPASNGGKVVWFAHGKSLDGKEDIDVNLGTIRGEAELYAPGSIVHYDIANDGTGEYVLSHRNGVEGAYEIARYYMKDGVAARYEISNKNQLVPLVDLNIEEQVYGEETVSGVDPVTGNAFDTFKYQPGVYSNVKFVFVDFDSNGEVETFIVKDGPLSTDWEDLIKFNEKWENIGTNDKNAYGNFCAEAYVSKKGEVKTVVIKDDTGDADLTNIILTTDTTRDEEVDANGVKWHGRKIVRGSNDFKSEESVLLDRFTNVGDFSRIVKETEDDGTKKLEIKALAGEFENDSVEPLKVFGIDYAKNANDSKNDKIGFVVGQGTNKVEDLQGNTLIAPAPAARASKTIVADFLGRESNMGDSVLDSDRIEGLIRVDSKTQWIDLRDIQDDRIDSLEELVSGDYDLSKVELRVLMNADKGSGSFRHAYVVAIIKAPVALPHPVFTVSNGTTTAESFTIKEGESITLTATCSGLTNDKSAGTVTYSWSVDGKAAGKGSSITLNSLTLGEHKVVVTATSDVKDTASTVKTITITVGEVKNVEEVTGTTEAITETMAKNVKATAQTMQTTGETRLNLEVEAPDWASTKTEAVLGTVSWKAVANGKEYTGTVDLNKSTGTGVKATAVDGATFKGYVEITSSDAWDTAALKRTDMVGKTLTSLEITGITWKYAKVNYVYAAEGEAEPVAITDGLTAGYTEYLPVGANGTLAFTYTKPAELTGTAVITVTGVDGEPKTVTSPVSETVKANGGEVVLVTVSGVTAPEPAVERTVKSSLTGTKALEFTVAAAGTAAPAADAEWAAEVKAEAGEVVFMRAAGEVALLATDSTGLAAITAIDTDTTTAVSLSAAQVVSGTASFTMVKQNLTIVGATVTTPEVDAYTVAEDGSTNILLKAEYNFADDNQKLQFVADYLKSEGISVTVNKGTSGTDILSLTISGVTVQPASIKVSHTLAKVKVGTDTIVCADVAGTATVANALDLAKVTIANASANVYVGLVKSSGTTAQATDSMTTVLTGVTEILVNEGRGYAKMASPAITVADNGATGQTAVNKPSVALDTASAALTFTDTNAYYPIGKELTVVGTFGQANLASFTAGAKFVASSATNFELVSSEELPAQTATGTADAKINAVIKVTGGAATVTISLATADI